jgi:chromosome segregation ATPase
MNAASQTVTSTAGESKDTEFFLDMRDRLQDLSTQLSSYTRVTSEFLIGSTGDQSRSASKVGLLTKVLFGVVAALTLILNLVLHFIDAGYGQMIIVNVSISVLYVLVGMCVISDLSKGRSYFQNERMNLQERLQTVTENLRCLLQERMQLTESLHDIKWQSENEQIKLQMSKMEVSSQQEKMEFLSTSIADKSLHLQDLFREISSAEDRNEKLQFEKQTLDAEVDYNTKKIEEGNLEIGRLVSEIESLKLRQADLDSTLQRENAALKEVLESRETRQREISTLEEALGRLNKEVLERETMLKSISVDIGDNEAQVAQLRAVIEGLNALIAALEQQVQSEQARVKEIVSERQSLEDRKQSIQQSIQDAGQTLIDMENQVESIAHTKCELEQGIQKLQIENLELVNQTVTLEAHLAAQMELVTQCEAQLKALGDAQNDKEVLVKRLHEERELAEKHVAHLLKSQSELDCLFVAKSIAEHIAEHPFAQSNLLLSGNDTHQASDVTSCPTCHRYELEDEKRLNIESMMMELEAKQTEAQAVIDESIHASLEAANQISDAERRVEMLNKKSDGLNEQIQERANELYQLKQELISIRAEKRELENTLQDKENADAELAEIKDGIERYHSEIDRLRSTIAELEESWDTKAAESNRLEREISELTIMLAETRSEMKSKENEITNLISTKLELEESCLLLRDANLDLLEAKNNAEKDLLAIKGEVAIESENLKKLLDEQMLRAEELDSLSDRLQSDRNIQADMEFQIDALRERKRELSELESRVERTQAQLVVLEEQASRAESEVHARKIELSETETRLDQMMLEVRQCEACIEKLQNAEIEASQRVHSWNRKEIDAIAVHESIINDVTLRQRLLEDLNREFEENKSRNAEVSSRLVVLAEEVKEAQAISEQWQEYIAKLQIEIQVSASKKEMLDKEIEALQLQSQSLYRETQLVRDNLDANNAKRAALNDERQAAEEILLQLRNEIKLAENSLDSYLSQQRDATEVLHELENTHSEFQSRIAAALEEHRVEEARLSSLREQFQQLESLILELQQQRDGYLLQLDELKRETQSVEKSTTERRTILTHLESKIKTLEQTVAKLSELEQDCRDRNTELNRIEREINELCLRKQSLDEEVADLESKQRVLHQLEEDLVDKTRTLDILKTESARQHDELQRLENEIEAKKLVEGKLAEKEKHLSDTEKTLQSLEEERQRREINLNDIEQKIIFQQEELNRVTSQFKHKSEQLIEIEELIEAKQRDADGLETKIEQSQKEMRKLAVLRSSSEETIAELMQEIDKRREEIRLTRQELRATEESEESMKIQLASIELQIDVLRKSKMETEAQLQATITQLETENTALIGIREEAERSSQELLSMEFKMQQLQEEIAKVNEELHSLTAMPESSTQSMEKDPSVLGISDSDKTLQIVNTDPATEGKIINPIQQATDIDEDVWGTLDALRQVEESVRVDVRFSTTDRFGSLRQRDSKPEQFALSNAVANKDPWSEIFTGNG